MPRLISLVIAALLCAACSSLTPTARLEPPQLSTELRHFSGSVLSGRQARGAEPVDLATALHLHCRLRYLRRVELNGLTRVAERARLVVSAGLPQPLLPTADAAAGGRVVHGAAARQYLAEARRDPFDVAELAELRGVLPVGVTVACQVFGGDSGPGSERVALLVSRQAPAGPVSVALQIDDWVAGSSAGQLRRQIVLLEDAPGLDGDPMLLLLPAPFGRHPGEVLMLELSVDSGGDALVHLQAMARCRRDLQREAAALTGDVAPISGLAAMDLTLAAMLRKLELAHGHRPSLVFLASTLQAPLALDLALIGELELLDVWGRAISAAVTGDAALLWQLERTAYALLAKRLDEDKLPQELRAMLARHAGEAGWFPGSVGALLKKCHSLPEWEALLIAENREFLDTSAPSSRVRAYDWLAARGLAPEDYDPLAERRHRRRALTAARVRAEAAAAKGGR